jgi:Homeodomain-like domain
MRSAEQFNAAQRLIADGMNDCAIARQIGVPRTTVRDWRRRPPIRSRDLGAPGDRAHDFSTLPAEAYCYLLGLYLGDGCISQHPRSWRLRIVLDTKYPAIIDRCRAAIDVLMAGQRAAVLQRPKNCAEVSLYSKHWPCLLPQHGPGKKHTRRIALEPWQQTLVDEATEEFILGLIHSDGCRVVANDRGVASVRYHFSNRSEDILGLFTAALDALEIPWTRSDWHTISIYRKAATARLDTFVGPKDRAVPLNSVHYTA